MPSRAMARHAAAMIVANGGGLEPPAEKPSEAQLVAFAHGQMGTVIDVSAGPWLAKPAFRVPGRAWIMRAENGGYRRLDGIVGARPEGAFLEADAKLMAAAPEMLEALSAIASQAICYGMAADETELRDWLRYISDKAEAALAKVRGEAE